MKTKEDVLKSCTVDGNVVKLPNVILDKKLYQEVAKSLQLIGGKWKGGKVFGFVFTKNPTELLEEIASGKKRNIKKEIQFYGTPDELADELVKDAEIELHFNLLEPSAGQGAIIKAIHRACGTMEVHAVELNDENCDVLEQIPNVKLKKMDFLDYNDSKFSCIIANPPFSNNQDIDHIYKMFELLKIGGRVVTISSIHWKDSKNKKETEFRTWLKKVNAVVSDIPAGKFKKSGTTVPTCKIIINK